MFSALAFLKPYYHLALVAALVTGAGAVYLKGREDGVNAQIAKVTREAEIAAITRGAAMRGIADALAEQKIRHTEIRHKIEERIIERPVYRACQHSPDQLQYINEALTGVRSPSSSVFLLPDNATESK